MQWLIKAMLRRRIGNLFPSFHKFGFVEIIMRIALKELGEIITGNTPSKKIPEFWDSDDVCFVKPDIIPDS